MDPIKILKRAWHILWSYRALWVFGLILALAAGNASNNPSNNSRYETNKQEMSNMTPQTLQSAFDDARDELKSFFENGVPELNATGADMTAFVWVVVALFVVMFIFGIVMAVARYVSEAAVIGMVDGYEASGEKMTVRQGFRIGWSKTAWRLFLINLIVNLPVIAFMLVVLVMVIGSVIAVVNGNAGFAAFSVVSTLLLVTIVAFVVIVITVVLHLFRNFFWRASVLEDLGVRESFSRGFEMIRENWKDVGLMWLVMIGLGIIWVIASVIFIIVTIPLVIVTAVIAALVVAAPFLLFYGIFSTFLGGWLTWIAAGLFVMPLFFTIAFSPWVLIEAWRQVYISIVWTLTYREIKALPAIEEAAEVPPAS